ncbi:ketoacyl-ACP synthase III family protein [Catellatospora citrea]|uniref:ketoacyl-ACP synthase III family protein n=1 Tax=Catellatospora citrea TaxID=53366 RepID=UPI0033C6EABA
MRYHDLHVAATGGCFPKGIPVDEAVSDGRYAEKLWERTRQQRVAVCGDDDSAPQLAASAGAQALARWGGDPRQVSLLLHAVATRNGMDGWNAGAYLQRRLLGGGGTAFEIHQLSNGAVGAIELAAAYLAADPSRTTAVITAADQFAPPVWNRWTASPGLVFADGGSALVLSRAGGVAQVLSCASGSDAALEGMQRGIRRFRPDPLPEELPVSLRDRTSEFSEVMPLSEMADRMSAGLRAVGATAAAEAGMGLTEADHYVMPNFGFELLRDECLRPLGDVEHARTTWDWGRQIGHAGAADQFGGLNHLLETRQVAPGDRVMIVSVGGGFNWTCAVLEITDVPTWEATLAEVAP